MLRNLTLEKFPELSLNDVATEIYYPKDDAIKVPPARDYTVTIRGQRRPKPHMRYKQYARAVNLYAKGLKKRYEWNKYIGINSFVEYKGELYRISTVDLLYRICGWDKKELANF